ncbi:tetratricopeptide repeat protein [Metabacillus iocasae]|uniref:Tetratricopeptide (TPR) repeat protein n=1 Tax=Priestia iocasae TaxID=2291674 RepID=A0ABS2QYE3_9BACI|nr:tetratricopeptide repeat protein [Metabacillus iocasae]MBM7704514.1 tetratricopeptide (TPR) repeat protein [Metabacillus iocasae]
MGKHSNAKSKIAQIVPFLQTGDYYFEKALKAYRKHDLHKAKRYLERAMQLDPKDPIVVCQLATVLTELGEYQQSNQLLFSVIHEMDEDMVDCYYFIANNYAHLGLFQEAQKYANRYMDQEEDGEFLEDAEDLLDLLSIEVEDDEDEFEQQDDLLIVKQEKAKLLLEQAKFEEAMELLNEIIEDYPQFWSAHNNLALTHFYLNHVDSAMAILDDVLQKNPGNLHALCNKLIFYYYCQQDRQVKELTEQLELVYPISIEHRYKLGATFALIGQYELAYKWLRQLYKTGFEGDSNFYYWLSHASYHVGNETLAKNVWVRVMEAMPEKEGEEPWLLIDQEETKLVQQIKRKCLSSSIEEQLHGLYLVTRLKEKEKFLLLEHVRLSLDGHSIIEEVYSYVWQDKQHVIFEVAELMEAEVEDKSQLSELLVFWFFVYTKVKEHEYDFQHVNVNGWASAVTYWWKKQKKEKVTQANMAVLYSISISTVSKYVKTVHTLLQ